VEEGVISGQIASTHGQITSEVSENWDRPSVMESKTPVRTVRELSIERNLNFWRILGRAAADWDGAKRAGVEMGDGLGATGWGWVSPGPPPWPS
jgi:hypothetical protein